MMTEHYSDITPMGTINEIISTFVEELRENDRHMLFKGELNIADVCARLETEINADEYVPKGGGKSVFIAIIPLLKTNLEKIKKQYNGERENNIILTRKSSISEGVDGFMAKNEGVYEASSVDMRDTRYDGCRETTERGGNGSEERTSGDIYGLWNKSGLSRRGSVLDDTPTPSPTFPSSMLRAKS